MAVPQLAGLQRKLTQQRGELSIRQMFSIISAINGLVLVYLIVTSAQQFQSGDQLATAEDATFLLIILLAVLALLSVLIINIRVIRPLTLLARQAQRIELGDSDALLSVTHADEIGRLVHALNLVLDKMRSAYSELDQSNADLRLANQQIADSIRYAGILQRSILPDHQLKQAFGDRHFVLWQPKDIVSGDYYLFHGDGSRCLAGVADCAGHGVPGAMMTMMARAGVDRSIQDVGISSPAAVLKTIDVSLRNILSDDRTMRSIATNMDMGLVVLDFKARQLRFAGARISLYWSNGHELHSIPGDSRALCDRRRGSYHDHDLPLLAGFTYYLSTDGYIDQAGGDDGFAVGKHRFSDWLLEHARKPLPEQQQAFSESLQRYRGDYPQRDDITILSFRFD